MPKGKKKKAVEKPKKELKKEEKIDLDKIVPLKLTLSEALEQMEEKLISRALTYSNNVQSKAAEMLGISRRVMHYKMKKYGMLS